LFCRTQQMAYRWNTNTKLKSEIGGIIMQKGTLKNVAYDYLYDSIVNNKLPPGTAIVERDISNMLGISRTPVREALKQLESEGLIWHFPLRGTFVSEITTQDVEEIFSLREVLEETALKTAIHEIRDEELCKLETMLNSLDEKTPYERYYNTDRELHNLIIRNGHNKRLTQFLETLNSQMERLRRISALTPKRMQKSKQEHLAIVEVLKQRDFEKTAELLKQHIINVKLSTLNVCRRNYYS
jgi:DNA-binding GntR family transcriptional regulator